MEEVYNAILRGLRSLGFYGDSLEEDYLQSLLPHVRNLRQAYRNECVNIDYSNADVQAAYLIAYYPGHIEMTFSILMEIWQRLSFGPEVKACFFGGGPGPEVAALARLLAEQEGYLQVGALTADIYDACTEGWSQGRRITGQYVVPSLWPGQVDLRNGQLDLCERNSFQGFTKYLQNYDLIIFQNCLNELGLFDKDRHSHFIENVNFLLDNALPDSIVIFADLANYQTNVDTLEELRDTLQERGDLEEVFFVDRSTDEAALRIGPIPSVIEQNLLVSANLLRPRRKIKYRALAVSKAPQDDPLDDDDLLDDPFYCCSASPDDTF